MTNFDVPAKLPECIVFDLDETIWPLDIDCTWGPPFSYNKTHKVVVDERGERIPLFRDILKIFALIQTFPGVKIAIASRTMTPDWAAQILKLYRIPELGNVDLYSLCSVFEMYDDRKTIHFRNIHKKTGIAYQDMLFFDDNRMNLCVQPLGVKVVLVDRRQGLTMDIFLEALDRFSKNAF
jgi:magnesium-dependent phosphatase 1